MKVTHTQLRCNEAIHLTPEARAAIKLRNAANAQFVIIVGGNGEATFTQRPGSNQADHVKALRALAMALDALFATRRDAKREANRIRREHRQMANRFDLGDNLKYFELWRDRANAVRVRACVIVETRGAR